MRQHCLRYHGLSLLRALILALDLDSLPAERVPDNSGYEDGRRH